MERHSRGLWAFLIVAFVVMGLCILAVVAVALGAITLPKLDLGAGTSAADRVERSFEVGASPTLTVKSFAGGVTVRAGEEGTIQVIATKKGWPKSRRDQITIDMAQEGTGVTVEIKLPGGIGTAYVNLDITAPAGTRLDVQTGSGGVTVEGITGDLVVATGSGGVDLRDAPGAIKATTGSGGIDVVGGGGPVLLKTGSGGIDYQGMPKGDCRFETGSGGIDLSLPAALNVAVDLNTGSGGVDVEYDVSGQVSRNKVEGTIGAGDQGSIYAHTGSGSIDLNRE